MATAADQTPTPFGRAAYPESSLGAVNLNLRSGPGMGNAPIMELDNYTALTVTGEQTVVGVPWVAVTLPDSTRGWIGADLNCYR